jgi:hypothetical protein
MFFGEMRKAVRELFFGEMNSSLELLFGTNGKLI